MLARLRATDIDEVRRVANMPPEEADRCVKAVNSGAAVDAWLVSNAAETCDAADQTSMPPEVVDRDAAAARRRAGGAGAGAPDSSRGLSNNVGIIGESDVASMAWG